MKRTEANFSAGSDTATKKSISTGDLIHYCGSWTWRAVEALTQAPDFNSEPSWVANRLNISVEAAKDALEGLERIGHLTKGQDDQYNPVEDKFFFSDSLDRADLFQIHNRIKEQISTKLTSRDCYANTIFMGSKNTVNEFYIKFCALIEEMAKKNELEGNAVDVYGLELSLGRLSREKQ